MIWLIAPSVFCGTLHHRLICIRKLYSIRFGLLFEVFNDRLALELRLVLQYGVLNGR